MRELRDQRAYDITNRDATHSRATDVDGRWTTMTAAKEVGGMRDKRAPRGAEVWQGLAGYHRGVVTDFYDATAVRLPAREAAFFSDPGLPVGPH